jgi:hypothetical protein
MSWYPSEGSLFYGNTHNQYDKAYGNKNQGCGVTSKADVDTIRLRKNNDSMI